MSAAKAAGSWKLEAGSWKLEAGSWKLEANQDETGLIPAKQNLRSTNKTPPPATPRTASSFQPLASSQL